MADHLGFTTTTSYPPISESTPNLDIIHCIRQNEFDWPARSYGTPYIACNSNTLKQGYRRSIDEYGRLERDVSTHFHPAWSLHESGQKSAYKSTEVYPESLDQSKTQLDLLFNPAIGPARRSASLERQVANRRASVSRRTLYASSEASKRTAKALLNDCRSTADRYVRRKPKKNKHLRCPELGCTDEFCGRWELERHKKSQHGLEPAVGDQSYYQCTIDDCNRRNDILPRADKIRNHIRSDHPWITDVEAQVQASAIVGSVEGHAYIGAGKDETAQRYKRSNQYLTPPDSTSDLSCGGRKDSVPTSDCTDLYCDTKAQRATDSSLAIQQQSDHPSLTACDHVGETIEYAKNGYGPYKVVNGDKNASTIGSSDPHSHDLPASNSNSASQLKSATHLAPENVDGDGKGKGRDTAGKTAVTSAASSAGHEAPRHHLVPPGLGKRKERGDEPPPDPPPDDQRQPPAKTETYVCGFCCAFNNNPRPCRWTPHSKTCHRFVSELKRFHEMHGLFYCGICFTDFPSKHDLTTHEESPCTQYRCFVDNCPAWGELVKSGCQHHSRKNLQAEIYQYLLLLAWRVREGQDTSSADLTAGSTGSLVGIPTTPRRGVRSASTVSRGSIAPLGVSFDANFTVRENTAVATPSVQEGSLPDRPLLSPLQNLSLSPRVNSLERLSALMWDRLEARIPGVDENLTNYYRENVSGDQQAPMPPYEETDLQYTVRVMENLARQLWNELRGVSHTARNELRDRVNDRIGGYLARRGNGTNSMQTPNPPLGAPIVRDAFDQSFTDFTNSQSLQPVGSTYNNEAMNAGTNTSFQTGFDDIGFVDNEAMQSNSTAIAPPPRLRVSPTLPLATARTDNTFANAQQNQQWRNIDGTSYTGTLDVQNSFPPGPLSRLPAESMFVHTGGDYGETSPAFEPPCYLDYDGS